MACLLLCRRTSIDLVAVAPAWLSAEVRLRPVAAVVDAGAVHRDEQACVRVLLALRPRCRRGRTRGEREPERRGTLSGDRARRRRWVGGRRRPTRRRGAVAARQHGGPTARRSEAVAAPRLGELAREVGVVRLSNELPAVTAVTDEHWEPSSWRRRAGRSTGVISGKKIPKMIQSAFTPPERSLRPITSTSIQIQATRAMMPRMTPIQPPTTRARGTTDMSESPSGKTGDLLEVAMTSSSETTSPYLVSMS